MYKVVFIFLALPYLLVADCYKCEVIRKEREENPEKMYEYYDEYLEEVNGECEYEFEEESSEDPKPKD